MKNSKSLIPDLKELGLLMLGFLPWMLFLFLSGHTMTSLKIAIVISLVATFTLGFWRSETWLYPELGYLDIFYFVSFMVDFLNNEWLAREMDLVSNVSLATIMWFTVLIGKTLCFAICPERHAERTVE